MDNIKLSHVRGWADEFEIFDNAQKDIFVVFLQNPLKPITNNNNRFTRLIR